jgi:hypothetical protein
VLTDCGVWENPFLKPLAYVFERLAPYGMTSFFLLPQTGRSTKGRKPPSADIALLKS